MKYVSCEDCLWADICLVKQDDGWCEDFWLDDNSELEKQFKEKRRQGLI